MEFTRWAIIAGTALTTACHHAPVITPANGVTIRVVTAADTTARIATIRLRSSADAPSVPLTQSADGRFHFLSQDQNVSFSGAFDRAVGCIALQLLVDGGRRQIDDLGLFLLAR